MLGDAVSEMEHRCRAFVEHPRQPQTLAEARELAVNDPDRSAHLNFPYLFIVIEECAAYFATPDDADIEAHALIRNHVLRLARESRAAGIHLCVVTQYPTKTNVPNTLKAQCQRIGLGTHNLMASLVTIDQKGLEKIKIKGRGKALTGTDLVDFQGFLLVHDPANDVDDRGDILNQITTQ